MEKHDPRIDAYIENSADFAKPILNHIRKIVHQASAEILETIKWGFPHFVYKGTVCSMASFKEHCAFGFWKSSLLSDPNHILQKETSEAMGQFGRISSIAHLPSDQVLIKYVQEAVALNEKGTKVVKVAHERGRIETPQYFLDILTDHPQAKINFEKFSSSQRKEYITWFEEAKTEATRSKRIATALEWLAEGKARYWKYKREI